MRDGKIDRLENFEFDFLLVLFYSFYQEMNMFTTQQIIEEITRKGKIKDLCSKMEQKSSAKGLGVYIIQNFSVARGFVN